MQYLLDTVTIIRHFSGYGKIGEKAARILDDAKDGDVFHISVISLMEIMYLAEKNRIPVSLNATFRQIKKSSLYSILNLTPEILIAAEKISFHELHDRLILASAKWLGVPVISSDTGFLKIKDVKVIW